MWRHCYYRADSSWYQVLRVAVSRGTPRSVDRECAGRNASSVKVSSQGSHLFPWWPSQYEEAKGWIKAERNRRNLSTLWQLAAQKLRGHYNYYGTMFNEAKLSYFHHACIGALFKWINRRSQKRSYNWEPFERRLFFLPLPGPPRGSHLINILCEHGAERKHKPKSRMREIRKYGSVRSAGTKTPVFT